MSRYEKWRSDYLIKAKEIIADSVARGEDSTSSKNNIIKKVAFLAIAAISLTLIAFRFSGKYAFVIYAGRAQLNILPANRSAVEKEKSSVRFSEVSLKGILAGYSAIELEIMHSFILESERSWVSRVGAWVVFHGVWVLKRRYANALHLVLHHHYGRSMCITRLAKIYQPIRVASLPHGLMNLEWMKDERLFPGVDTEFCSALDEDQASVMSEVKGVKVPVFGPCKELMFRCRPTHIEEIVFISSGIHKYANSMDVLSRLIKVADELDIGFSFRPHPHERAKTLGLPFEVDVNQGDLLRKENNFIAVGFASTLLVELSYIGIKTIWIKNQQYSDQMAYGDARRPSTLVNSASLDCNAITREVIEKICDAPVFDPRLKPFLSRVEAYARNICEARC